MNILSFVQPAYKGQPSIVWLTALQNAKRFVDVMIKWTVSDITVRSGNRSPRVLLFAKSSGKNIDIRVILVLMNFIEDDNPGPQSILALRIVCSVFDPGPLISGR